MCSKEIRSHQFDLLKSDIYLPACHSGFQENYIFGMHHLLASFSWALSRDSMEIKIDQATLSNGGGFEQFQSSDLVARIYLFVL